MPTFKKNKKKVGLFRIILIIILGIIATLLSVLLAIGMDKLIYLIQKVLFGNNDIILLVPHPFIVSYDGFAIVIIGIGVTIAAFYKFKRKTQVIAFASVIGLGLIFGSVFSCTVFDDNSIIERNITHITSVSYQYSQVKQVNLYFTIDNTGKSSSHVMHYELEMKDGNKINLNSNKYSGTFDDQLSKYAQIEEKIKDVPHFTDNEFKRDYENQFPKDYFDNFMQVQ